MLVGSQKCQKKVSGGVMSDHGPLGAGDAGMMSNN